MNYLCGSSKTVARILVVVVLIVAAESHARDNKDAHSLLSTRNLCLGRYFQRNNSSVILTSCHGHGRRAGQLGNLENGD